MNARTVRGTKVITLKWMKAKKSEVAHQASRGNPTCLMAGYKMRETASPRPPAPIHGHRAESELLQPGHGRAVLQQLDGLLGFRFHLKHLHAERRGLNQDERRRKHYHGRHHRQTQGPFEVLRRKAERGSPAMSCSRKKKLIKRNAII